MLHIRCAYLNYWNYPFASTRYSVTHEVRILVIRTIVLLELTVLHVKVCILVIGTIFPQAPDTVLHTRCVSWCTGVIFPLASDTVLQVHMRCISWSLEPSFSYHQIQCYTRGAYLGQWSYFPLETYSVTRTHEVRILVIGTIFPSTKYSVTHTHKVRILVIGTILPLEPDTVLHMRCVSWSLEPSFR